MIEWLNLRRLAVVRIVGYALWRAAVVNPSCGQVALFEYRDKDASADVKEADAMQQSRNKHRVAVRLSLDPTSGACDSTSDNVTSLDVAETLQRGLGALHCPMPVQHRTRAEPTVKAEKLPPSHTRIRLQTHIRSAFVVPMIGTPIPLSHSSSSSALHSMRITLQGGQRGVLVAVNAYGERDRAAVDEGGYALETHPACPPAIGYAQARSGSISTAFYS
ncbi:hypothetical protein M422DRAFT_274839 [Sphaerobolus stellatus SS14]|uniref:Uncharacterized protein n=1 Tax=Sphaerobolus stellatus (strain SS14) TaxID=990650 RepID=A0A0C9U5P9_SPHS4|nr:hypothetical protein M422DRAFT_274839 [Sphaerobolus stellatus SS14]